MLETRTIKQIQAEQKSSWEDKAFMTFDLDWACDDVLSYTIDLIEKADLSATWFVTHKTKILDRLRENPKFELAIHPNFNFLLEGSDKVGKNAKEVVDNLMNIVPEATSVRSHSLTQSSRLMQLFESYELTHDCNDFIPFESKIRLQPWRTWNNLQKVPYSWTDDITVLNQSFNSIQESLECSELKVIAFHPIHVFLNTDSIDRYENSRHIHQHTGELKNFVNHKKVGVQDLLTHYLSSLK